MDNALIRKFKPEQRITISNPKMTGYAITRPWRSAMHLVDRGWKIIGSEAKEVEEPKKNLEKNVVAPVASVKINSTSTNDDLFNLEKLQDKYSIIFKRKPDKRWGIPKLLEKIKDA